MDSIGIVTEKTADLPPEIIEEHQIATIPAILNWAELSKLFSCLVYNPKS
jgi:fatty acid-binding protein DegV